MAAKTATQVQVSLKDVEPVKTFIADIGAIYDDLETPPEIRERIAAACRKLNGGFGTLRGVTDASLAEWRGWRLKPDEIRYEPVTDWPSVCIVIPVFNSPALLRQALASLMRTDYAGELMYMLVDNASTDPETLELLRTRAFTPIRFDEPVGFAAAVNAGMRAAEADYYVLFNQDCRVIDEQWLTNIIRWMEHRPQCAVAGPKLVYPAKEGEPTRIQHAGIVLPKGACATHRHLNAPANSPEVSYIEKVPAVTGAVFAIRASALEEIGYLDESYRFGCEDVEFCLRAAAHGHEVWYVSTSTVAHHDHGVTSTNARSSLRIREWAEASGKRFRSQWGAFIDRCATESVAFVLPDYNPVAGGCRVVAALANSFINAGMETTVYVMSAGGRFPDDPDLPRLFEIEHISKLRGAGTLIATRFDTVEPTLEIPAAKRFYLVQQIETPMAKYCGATEDDVLRSYQHTEYEIITIGRHLANQLAEMGRTSIALDAGLYVGLYPFRPHQRGERFRVLMYGSPADYKGGQDAPKIAAALRERFGAAVEINSFHRDMPPPGWADRHYRPRCTSEVAAIYSDHDCYVYASHSDGFAMTPVEAMACGTPVVLTDFPGKDQYAKDGDNCLVAGFRDIAGMVNAVGAVIDDDLLRRTLVSNGRRTAERYDWRRVGLQYLRTMLGAPV